MICQAKSPLATLPPASAPRRGRGEGSPQRGQRGCARGGGSSAPPEPLPASARQTAGAEPFAGIACTGLGTSFPSISAARVCPAVSVAALAFPSQPPLLPECRTTSRSRAVALGAGEPGLGRQSRGAGRGSPSRHHVEFGTALRQRANSDQIMAGLLFFPLPFLFNRKGVLRAVRAFFFFCLT